MTDLHGRADEAGDEAAPADPALPALPKVELPPINRAPADRSTAGYLAATPGFGDVATERDAHDGDARGRASDGAGHAEGTAADTVAGAGDGDGADASLRDADAAAADAADATTAPGDGRGDEPRASGAPKRARALWITVGVAVVLAAAATWLGLSTGFFG